jgi:hypothetical protein
MTMMRRERYGYDSILHNPVGRVMYRMRRTFGWFMVIADFLEDGSCHFAEAEHDEPRWHSFAPCPEELARARQLLSAE